MDKERIGIVAAARLARLASSKRSMTMSCWRRCASVSMLLSPRGGLRAESDGSNRSAEQSRLFGLGATLVVFGA
jgi:hypothetical protein